MPEAAPNRRGPMAAELAATAAVVAVALAYDPSAAAADPKRVSIIVFAIGAVATGFALRRQLELSVPVLLLGGYVAWCATSVAWGAPSGWLRVALLAGVLGVAVWACSVRRDRAIALTARAAAGIGFGIGTFALVQWALGARGLAIHGGVGNPNWLGLTLAATLLPTADAVWHRRHSRGAAIRYTLSLLVQLAAWGIAGSRAAWIAVPLGALVAVGVSRWKPGLVTLAVGSTLVVSVLAPFAMDGIGGEGAMKSLRGRIWIWNASLDAAATNWIAGTGVGEYVRGFLEAQGAELSRLPAPQAARTFTNAKTAHNEWVQALAETGIIGFGLLAAFGLRLIRELTPAWPAGAGAVAAIALSAGGDSPLHLPTVLILVALLAACAPRTVLVRTPRLVWGLSVALLALSLIPTTRRWMSTRLTTESRRANMEDRPGLIERSARIDPHSAEAAFELGLLRLQRSDHDGAIAAFERSRALEESVATVVSIGNAYFTTDRLVPARESFEHAVRLNPGSFRARTNLALARLEEGDLDAAERQLEQARLLLPGHPKLAAIRERVRLARIERATR